MLTQLMALTKAQLKAKIQSIDATGVKGRAMRRQLAAMKKKEGGFTLLELLVVVAILAAIAGTATIMLQDTDRKASAGAHVAMMDELSKGIQTYRTINNAYPDNWDSLLQVATAAATYTTATPLVILSEDLTNSITAGTIAAAELTRLSASGVTQVRLVAGGIVADGATCDVTDVDALQAIINDKSNAITAQNIYRPAAANGCGQATSHTLVADDPVMVWNAVGNKRVNAFNNNDVYNGKALTADDKLVAFGVGPDATLFDTTKYGGLTNTPIYRHVEPDEYNRFIVLFKVAGAGVSDKALFQAIVDGAGDTKDEELGELDNVRGT